MNADHVERNRASRERLAALIARLGERTVVLPDGWTAAAVLGHLAFWDRVTLARWEKHLREGRPLEAFPENLVEFVNAAGLPQWTATPLGSAIADVTAATESVDLLIAGVSRSEAEEAYRTRPRLVDRSLHRNEHLDGLERALE